MAISGISRLHAPLSNDEVLAAVEALSCGVVARDSEGIVVYVNDRFLNWLGYPRDEVLGRPLGRLMPSDLQEIGQAERRATDEGDYRARVTVLRRRDGTTMPVLAVPSPAADESSAVFAVVVELAAIQTARSAGQGLGASLRATLEFAIPIGDPEIEAVSRREREVLELLVTGDRVPVIARRLHISPHTVRNHLKSMYRKLGVGSQSELIERVRSAVSERL
jgi:PAS domain S-box-containing protein